MQEKIFLRILAIFKMEYGSLLKEDFTNLDIIRWCVEKGYLQQAMTLCSEWIPGVIVASHIFYPIRSIIQDQCEQKRKDYQTWEHYFINTYTPINSRRKNAPPSEEDVLRKVILLFCKNRNIDFVATKYPEATEKLKPLLNELMAGQKAINKIKSRNSTPSALKAAYPMLYAVIYSLYVKHEGGEEFIKRKKNFSDVGGSTRSVTI